MKYCPKCNNLSTIGDEVFCYKDGTKLKESDSCVCGKVLTPYYNFCPACGRPVNKTK